MNGPEEGAQSRDERVETYYQESARDPAERIVELEDELGADVGGICTGMHADVAEAHSEIQRLNNLVHAENGRADFNQNEAEEARADADFWEEWARGNAARIAVREAERDRYRLAWLSARRRAALESVYAAEALAIRDAELATERARQASFVAELQPAVRARMDEVRRLRAFAADVKLVRGRTICDGNEIDHLRDVHANLHELEAADREGRPYISHLVRTYPAADGT